MVSAQRSQWAVRLRLKKGPNVAAVALANFRAEPMRDDHGDIVKWYGANVDIAERKRAESLVAAEKRSTCSELQAYRSDRRC